MNPLLDTNVLVDFLRGVEAARKEIARYEEPAISLVTWMEVLVGSVDTSEDGRLRAFLRKFEVLDVTHEIAERAIVRRRAHRVKLPDALIWATADVHGLLLVTRNTRDFPVRDPGIRIPYRL